MDSATELRDFLGTRRARITPEQVGIKLYGGRRRVPGLRREEVAMLAGVSTDYYVRLEKGNLSGVSESVLNAVADALRFNEAERVHLFDLVRSLRAAGDGSGRRVELPAGVRWMLDSLTASPAFVADACLDVVAINELGRRFYLPMFDGGEASANFARFCFLDPRSRELYPDWDGAAGVAVAQLRMAMGRDPRNERLAALVTELRASSEEFRTRWSAHEVRLHRSGFKRFFHPVAGEMEVAYTSMELPTDRRLVLTVYTTEPGSSSDQAMQLLRAWAAARGTAEIDQQRSGESVSNVNRAPRI